MVCASIVAAVAASACTETGNVVDVHMALDEDGWIERNEFFTDSAKIYCVGRLGLGRRTAILGMRIRTFQLYDFLQNKFIDVDGVGAVNERQETQSKDPKFVNLQLKPLGPSGSNQQDVPFLPGRYECEVYLDGELQGTAPFNILFPPCPDYIIAPETRCYGYFREQDTCPRYGATSTNPRKCICTAAEGWACPAQ